MFEIIDLKEVIRRLNEYDWKEIHVHHTWKPSHNHFTGENHIALQQGMYEYHVNVKGWDNIAQHLTLFPEGKFVTGRPLNEMPISILGENKVGALAVEMVGNFDNGHDKFEGDQKMNMLMLARYFMNKDLPIKFHNEYSNKSCPGTSIVKKDFISEVENLFNDHYDIPTWAIVEVEKAKKRGLIKGNDEGNLLPNQQVTKVEAITMINRVIDFLANS